MSSGTTSPTPVTPDAPVVPPPTEREVVIDRRLRQTQRQVKGVDIAAGLIALAIGVLAYLLTAAVIDHWLIVGGLGFWGRFWLWAALVVVAVAYFARRVMPPLVHRINPLFAAATIEKSQPSLKNSLINFLLLRGHRREVAVPVYQAIENRAATDLSGVEIEVAVDRSRVIRRGIVLAGVLAVFCLYLVLSPKNPLRSAARVLLPWASIEAPTRVTIRDVQPGDTSVFHGDSVTVSAEVAGLRQDEPVVLMYSTADGQLIDQGIRMTPLDDGLRYQCQLPPGNVGVQQDYQYYLAAGDCRTRVYHVEAQIAPSIVVDSVSYHYPAYTGLADQMVLTQGDLRAIEGTEVTIHATANTEIKPGAAEIDLGCTGRPGLRMSVDGRAATGQFTLRLDPADPSRGEYNSYQLRFTDLKGRENERPIRHRIDVIRDLPPEVQIVDPQQDEVTVAANGKVDIKVRAEDPDFALRRVTLQAQRDGRDLPIPPLLDAQEPKAGWPGEFSAVYEFSPARLGLKAGDTVVYWTEADDNRQPTAGHTASKKQRIIVGARRAGQSKPADGAKGNRTDEGRQNPKGDAGRNQSDNQTGAGQKQQPSSDVGQKNQPQDTASAKQGDSGQPNEEKADSASDKGNQGGKSGQDKRGQQSGDQLASADKQQGDSSADRNQRVDPDTDPGDAMEKILKDRQQQQDKQEKRQSQDNQSQGSGEKSGDQQSGSGKSGQGQSDEQKSTADKADSQKAGQDNATKGDAGSAKSDSGKSAGATSAADKPSGDQSESEQGDKGDKGKSAAAKTDKGSSGNQQGDSEKQASAADKSGSGKQGDEKPGTEKPSADKSDANQPGAGAGGTELAGADKSNKGKSNGEQRGSEPGTEKSGTAKPSNEKVDGDKGGEQQAGDVKSGTEKPGTDASDAATERTEKSGTAAGGTEQQKQDAQRVAEQKQGNARSAEKQQPGDGKNVGNNQANPEPQGANAAREKKAGQAGEAPGERKGDMAKSPSTSRKQSDSKGDTAGDRSGGGEQGGGQQANKSGIGSGGSHTAADEGAGKAEEQGRGEAGQKAGDQTATKQPTGSTAKQQADNGSGTGQQKSAGNTAGGKSDDKSAPGEHGTPAEDQPNGRAQATGAQANNHGPGTPTGGGKPGKASDAAPPPAESPADAANLEYARRQSALALEHLREQMAKEKPKLLDQLGWSKEDARRFLDRWEAMQRAAAEKGAAGDAARKQFNEALRSLGLRPRSTELRGGITVKQPQDLKDSGRFAAPPDWADQVRQYTRGVAGEDRQGKQGGTP